MSKIKISEIESFSSNADLTLTPDGTGSVEIKSDDTDGALQLNSTGNSSKAKIKAPPSTAAQNYTLILPDNQIAQDKYLKVKSITGSGATAVGQLEFATVVEPSVDLDLAQVTTGTIDSARLPSPLPAASGLGLKHIHTTIVSTSTHQVTVQDLEADSLYRIMIRNWHYNSYGGKLYMYFLDTNNVVLNSSYSPAQYYDVANWYSYRYNPGGYTLRNQESSGIQIDGDHYSNNHQAINFVADLWTGSTANPRPGIHIKAMRNRNYNAFNAYTNGKLNSNNIPVGGFKLYNSPGYQLNYPNGAEVVVYQYMEA
mgnify:CR=1 FL=1|tara:strand:- start:1698 stop:2633 length:936 start_codon:yes stop_codon:yes gene_type:complete